MDLDGGDFRMGRIDPHHMDGKSSGAGRREGGGRFRRRVERHHELLLVLVDVKRGGLVGHDPKRHRVAFDAVEH